MTETAEKQRRIRVMLLGFRETETRIRKLEDTLEGLKAENVLLREVIADAAFGLYAVQPGDQVAVTSEARQWMDGDMRFPRASFPVDSLCSIAGINMFNETFSAQRPGFISEGVPLKFLPAMRGRAIELGIVFVPPPESEE